MPPNVIEEFFAPDQGLEIAPYLEAENMMGIHHLARYHWAKEVLDLLKPASVLDIACVLHLKAVGLGHITGCLSQLRRIV